MEQVTVYDTETLQPSVSVFLPFFGNLPLQFLGPETDHLTYRFSFVSSASREYYKFLCSTVSLLSDAIGPHAALLTVPSTAKDTTTTGLQDRISQV